MSRVMVQEAHDQLLHQMPFMSATPVTPRPATGSATASRLAPVEVICRV